MLGDPSVFQYALVSVFHLGCAVPSAAKGNQLSSGTLRAKPMCFPASRWEMVVEGQQHPLGSSGGAMRGQPARPGAVLCCAVLCCAPLLLQLRAGLPEGFPPCVFFLPSFFSLRKRMQIGHLFLCLKREGEGIDASLWKAGSLPRSGCSHSIRFLRVSSSRSGCIP